MGSRCVWLVGVCGTSKYVVKLPHTCSQDYGQQHAFQTKTLWVLLYLLGLGSTKRITTVSLSLSLFCTAQPTPGSGNKEELGSLDLIPLVIQYLLQGSVHHVLKLLGHTTR